MNHLYRFKLGLRPKPPTQNYLVDFYRKNIGTTWKIWASAETVNRVWTLIGWPSRQWGRRYKGCWETEAIPGGWGGVYARLVSDKSVSDTFLGWSFLVWVTMVIMIPLLLFDDFGDQGGLFGWESLMWTRTYDRGVLRFYEVRVV